MDWQADQRRGVSHRRKQPGSLSARGASAPPRVLDMNHIAQLRELGGDDEPDLVLDLIELFLSDAHHRLAEMRLALMSGDLETIARAAHTLKSSAGSMGAEMLSQICREVEELARKRSPREVESRAKSCFEAYERTEKALKLLERLQ